MKSSPDGNIGGNSEIHPSSNTECASSEVGKMDAKAGSGDSFALPCCADDASSDANQIHGIPSAFKASTKPIEKNAIDNGDGESGILGATIISTPKPSPSSSPNSSPNRPPNQVSGRHIRLTDPGCSTISSSMQNMLKEIDKDSNDSSLPTLEGYPSISTAPDQYLPKTLKQSYGQKFNQTASLIHQNGHHYTKVSNNSSAAGDNGSEVEKEVEDYELIPSYNFKNIRKFWETKSVGRFSSKPTMSVVAAVKDDAEERMKRVDIDRKKVGQPGDTTVMPVVVKDNNYPDELKKETQNEGAQSQVAPETPNPNHSEPSWRPASVPKRNIIVGALILCIVLAMERWGYTWKHNGLRLREEKTVVEKKLSTLEGEVLTLKEEIKVGQTERAGMEQKLKEWKDERKREGLHHRAELKKVMQMNMQLSHDMNALKEEKHLSEKEANDKVLSLQEEIQKERQSFMIELDVLRRNITTLEVKLSLGVLRGEEKMHKQQKLLLLALLELATSKRKIRILEYEIDWASLQHNDVYPLLDNRLFGVHLSLGYCSKEWPQWWYSNSKEDSSEALNFADSMPKTFPDGFKDPSSLFCVWTLNSLFARRR